MRVREREGERERERERERDISLTDTEDWMDSQSCSLDNLCVVSGP